ncbi:MAG TPA: GldG family protein [Candidatus Galloscillospira excrementipullorum]|nr:GldG family protein [Candidatus Galloscillospira excrementipullorum]
MKLPHVTKPSESAGQGRNALLGGSYSLALTAILLAILIALNVLVGALPASQTKYDISSSKLHSITSNTKVVVNALEEDVTIYWVVQAGQKDEILENLLSKYESLSEHIEVVEKNPDIFPAFAEQYTSETVPNNSLIVECGQRSRFISYNDIYLLDSSLYGYNASFDGEGAITSAIDYVTTDELPQLYLLEGHGEAELPATLSDQLEKENIEVQSLSLLTVDAIPEDADCLMIYAPSSDISSAERDLLTAYVKAGGSLFVVAGPMQDGLPENLLGLVSEYGVQAIEGMVVEQDRGYYAFQSPYLLMPELADDDITNPLTQERYFPILPAAMALTVEGGSSQAEVTELLTTSPSSFSQPVDAVSPEKEEDDPQGPFAVGVRISHESGGQIIWFSSSLFLEDFYNAYSSGANVNLGVNAIASLVGERDATSIRSKSLNYNYLTISDSASSVLKGLIMGVFPLLYLDVGIAVVWKRRKHQNEPC